MSTFEIGPGLSCDLDLLIASRLLVQASSGQGKTRTIRRLLEQTHGQVQQLVIDPEGEYHTLREHFDYVLAAPKGGDVVAHPKHAGLLAQKLLELGVSAICDIYELNPKDRIAFVRRFFEALVNAPRALWHPVLVVLDEAHVYAPEKGEAESADAVIALASRGRKRAYCLVAATQRLAKLKKDAAAELGNKLIGGTNLDIDVKRAAEELGFTEKTQQVSLRALRPGEFYAIGRAFVYGDGLRARVGGTGLVMVGGIISKHPEPGEAAAPTPPPTAQIRKVLEKLSSLPAEAEAREKSLADLQKENADLRRQYAQVRGQPLSVPQVERVEVPVLLGAELADARTAAAQIRQETDRLVDQVGKVLGAFAGDVTDALTALGVKVDAGRVAPNTRASERVAPIRAPRGHARSSTPVSADDLTGTQRKILDTLVMLSDRALAPGKERVARWMGIHPNGGRYNSDLARLRADGYLDGWVLTHRAWAVARRQVTGLPAACAALRSGTRQAIINALNEDECKIVKQGLAARLGIHPNGGRFNSDLSWLRTMGLIPERGLIYLTPEAYR